MVRWQLVHNLSVVGLATLERLLHCRRGVSPPGLDRLLEKIQRLKHLALRCLVVELLRVRRHHNTGRGIPRVGVVVPTR